MNREEERAKTLGIPIIMGVRLDRELADFIERRVGGGEPGECCEAKLGKSFKEIMSKVIESLCN